jgi:hypothetical protein
MTANGTRDRGSKRSDGERDPESVPKEILATLRSSVRLWVPFVIVGCLWTVLDRLRLRDPLPVRRPGSGSTLQVVYTPYPTGAPGTVRTLDALVDLPADVFVYALMVELVAVSSVAAASWLTMTWASDVSFSPHGSFVYFVGVGGLYLTERVGTAISLEYSPGSLLVGVTALGIVVFIAVRTFFLPIALLLEPGILAAIRTSWSRSVSHGFALAALIVTLGLGAGWLAELPAVGVLLSAAVVGPVHSVALVVLYERYSDSSVTS